VAVARESHMQHATYNALENGQSKASFAGSIIDGQRITTDGY
jgi:hypothetical protein